MSSLSGQRCPQHRRGGLSIEYCPAPRHQVHARARRRGLARRVGRGAGQYFCEVLALLLPLPLALDRDEVPLAPALPVLAPAPAVIPHLALGSRRRGQRGLPVLCGQLWGVVGRGPAAARGAGQRPARPRLRGERAARQDVPVVLGPPLGEAHARLLSPGLPLEHVVCRGDRLPAPLGALGEQALQPARSSTVSTGASIPARGDAGYEGHELRQEGERGGRPGHPLRGVPIW